MIDLRRLDRIIGRLQPEDAAWLSATLEPAWRQRERRTAEWHAAIRAAAGELAPMPRTRTAKTLQRLLDRYLASAWRSDQAAGRPTPNNAALYRIATLTSDGRGIGWRRIYDILSSGNGLSLQQSLEEVAIRRS